ncbi:hypothetical protein, partial [Mesorhizobium sp.]|uniref:hypothetical protein n=1 Tax=Mesorhizobium sp. TaxID=1871066 RepID=UPI0025C412CF
RPISLFLRNSGRKTAHTFLGIALSQINTTTAKLPLRGQCATANSRVEMGFVSAEVQSAQQDYAA